MAVAVKPIKVYIEQDGVITDISGQVVSMSLSMQFDDLVETELRILGTAHSYVRTDFIRSMNAARSSAEWKCEWCGHVNPASARTCGDADSGSGCGAARSFIYE